jgi:hypothetical protein
VRLAARWSRTRYRAPESGYEPSGPRWSAGASARGACLFFQFLGLVVHWYGARYAKPNGSEAGGPLHYALHLLDPERVLGVRRQVLRRDEP